MEICALVLAELPRRSSLKTYAEACQLTEDMAINSYMWLAERFTYIAKQFTINVVDSEYKYLQVLERFNELDMYSGKAQVQNQPILKYYNARHDGEGAMWEMLMRATVTCQTWFDN